MSIYPLWSFRNRTIKIEEKAKNKASPCFLCLPLCLSLLSLCLASLGVSPIVCLLLSLPFAILKKNEQKNVRWIWFMIWKHLCVNPLSHKLTHMHTRTHYTQEHIYTLSHMYIYLHKPKYTHAETQLHMHKQIRSQTPTRLRHKLPHGWTWWTKPFSRAPFEGYCPAGTSFSVTSLYYSCFCLSHRSVNSLFPSFLLFSLLLLVSSSRPVELQEGLTVALVYGHCPWQRHLQILEKKQ